MDRFDITGKVPAGTTPEQLNLMLQSALADRFKLVLHKDSKSLPAYALMAGKKPQLKEAAGTEDTGCRVADSGGGGGRIMIGAAVAESMGVPQQITLGPGMTIQYSCHNMTMAAFASGLPRMMGASSLGTNPIIEDTGLTGNWNFDVHWSFGLNGSINGVEPDRITVADAVEKQLGLKLEERHVPTPVLIVDSVNEKPSENPPGTAEALPRVAPPTQFEVASVKPADPNGRGSRYQLQPGGRLTSVGMTLHALVNQAFNVNNPEQVVGLPPFADTVKYDITAKAPSDDPSAPAIDRESAAPMIRSLLVDRFKMTYHTEERPQTAYSLIAAKPKMKKADPSSRTFCENAAPPPGSPPASTFLNCHNTTMAQLADRIQSTAQELNWPVLDATGLEGGYDFSVMFSRPMARAMMAGMPLEGLPARGGGAGGDAASDPNGAQTIFEAFEKQLGLKLDKQKRNEPVIVIDHLEEKPTDN
jgi:uncharacterized protein (TIGR03435 family)